LTDGRGSVKQSGIAIAPKTGETGAMTLRTFVLAGLSALLCTTATASTPAPKPEFAVKGKVRPGLWKLADADTTIYLFGTIHVLPANFNWRSARFNAAAASADELVLEVADTDDQAKLGATMMRLAVSPDLLPVRDRLPPSKRPSLDAVMKKAGIPAGGLDRFESWAVAITLAATMLKELNVSPDSGVERLLTKEFRAAKKPVNGLETSEWQLSLFDKLPTSAQDAFLLGVVDDQDDPKAEYAKMLRAWTKGDDDEIALSFDDEAQLSKELADVLLRQRNANWTAWLAKRLEKPGTTLVAVGAGHLAGADSVQRMLRERGFKVTRVQ
jgi:uncharacterized protein